MWLTDVRNAESASAPPPAANVVQQYARLLQDSLGRTGRAPFALAGLAMFADLQAVQASLSRCLALREESHLRRWHTVLSRVLPQYAPAFAAVQQGQAWVNQLRDVLAQAPLPTGESPPLPEAADTVARNLARVLGSIADRPLADDWLAQFRQHIFKVSDSYWSGLFHCYRLVGVPRTNNALESLFGEARQRRRRQTGRCEQRQDWLRHGAWLLYRSEDATVADLLQRLQQVSPEAYRTARQRFMARQERFRLRWHWRHQPAAVLQQLEDGWRTEDTL